MSEYYAVQRSDNSLKHYGVRGMKWGVRKAIESKNSARAAKKLSRQYSKAQKKLAKLEKRADIGTQQRIATKSNKVAKRAFGVGVAGVGTATGSKLLSSHLINKAAQSAVQVGLWKNDKKRVIDKLANNRDATIKRNWESLKDPKNYSGISKDEAIKRTESYNKDIVEKYYNKDIARERDFYDTQINAHQKASDRATTGSKISNVAHKVAGGVGAAAFGVAAGAKIRASIAKHRTTAKGHAKAVAKRDAWKKEMQSAFKGTKYANGTTNRQGKKRRKAT